MVFQCQNRLGHPTDPRGAAADTIQAGLRAGGKLAARVRVKMKAL